MTSRLFPYSFLLSTSCLIASPNGSTNIAPKGEAIMGLEKPSAISSPSTSSPFFYVNSTTGREHLASWLNDTKIDNLHADTWAGHTQVHPNDTGVDFIGIKNLPNSPNTSIHSLTFHGLTFKDGGWFGINGSLDPSEAIAPQLQYSTDNGDTWKNHPSQSDYVSQVAQAGLEAEHYSSTFTFAPIHGANAIRLIGTTGGKTRLDTNGFVGARELIIHAQSSAANVDASTLISINSINLILK